MSEFNKFETLSDDALGTVAGGMTRDLKAAYAVLRGDYGNGSEREKRLKAAGYDFDTVQRLVNGLVDGYDKVANDVIAGKYGNNEARVKALKDAGYDAQLVQDIVNGMLLN